MNINTFLYNGFIFTYSIQGSGPTILVPGGPSHYSQTFGRELKKEFTFVFVDHRGFAQPVDDNEIDNLPSMEDLVNDLEAFRLHLKLESFYILGHSGHAYLALAYAKKHSDPIKGIIILSAGPDLSRKHREVADHYFEEMADRKRKFIHENNLKLMQKEMAEKPGDEFKIFCIRSAARSSYDPLFDPAPLWHDMHLNLNIVLHMWSHLFSQEIEIEGLRKIALPVFIGMGLHDYQVPPHFTWNEYKTCFQKLRFRVFPKSGHNPQMEESESFLTELRDWMSINIEAQH